MPALKLANHRRPLADPKTLSASEKKQLTMLLKQEGTTIARAAKDPEMTIDAVDVVEGGRVVYQLYLWPFGSGALLEAGTTTIVANVAQHAFEMVDDDAKVRAAIAAAWKAGAKKLGLADAIASFDAPQTVAPAAATGGVLAQLAQFKATGARLNLSERPDIAQAMYDLKNKLWPREKKAPWRPYPRVRPATLTPEQRAYIDTAHALGATLYLETDGLFDATNIMVRMIGVEPQGPSDVDVTVGKETLPLWCAVSDVGSGHMDHAAVLSAFQKLPRDAAVAAWKEIADGGAYDVLTARPLSMKETSKSETPAKQQYRARVYSWLADASVALGEDGIAAARWLLAVDKEWDWAPRAQIGLLALARHGGIDPSYDRWVTELMDPFASPTRCSRTEFSKATLAEIVAALPPDRRAAATRKPT